MVHALNEIHRTLILGGFLIDLRPFHKQPPVEIVSGVQFETAGHIDDSDGYVDDVAANQAIHSMVERGLFRLEATTSFELFTYWDTATDFKIYMDERSSATLPNKTYANTLRLMERLGPNARLRTRLNMIMSRYHKSE